MGLSRPTTGPRYNEQTGPSPQCCSSLPASSTLSREWTRIRLPARSAVLARTCSLSSLPHNPPLPLLPPPFFSPPLSPTTLTSLPRLRAPLPRTRHGRARARAALVLSAHRRPAPAGFRAQRDLGACRTNRRDFVADIRRPAPPVHRSLQSGPRQRPRRAQRRAHNSPGPARARSNPRRPSGPALSRRSAFTAQRARLRPPPIGRRWAATQRPPFYTGGCEKTLLRYSCVRRPAPSHHCPPWGAGAAPHLHSRRKSTRRLRRCTRPAQLANKGPSSVPPPANETVPRPDPLASRIGIFHWRRRHPNARALLRRPLSPRAGARVYGCMRWYARAFVCLCERASAGA